MASALHLLANAVHPREAPEVHPSVVPDVIYGLCSTLDGKCSKHQVKLLMYMMAYSVYLLAYTVHHVRLLIYMIGYADHLMANVSHWSEAPKVHLSVVPNVRWWPLQYTQVRLLKYTPVLFLMLDDALCSTVDDKCSTPKWSFRCTWWHIHYTCWHIQYTQERLLQCTPLLFLMLDDDLCIILVGKCSTPKWGSWSAPQCCSWC